MSLGPLVFIHLLSYKQNHPVFMNFMNFIKKLRIKIINYDN